MADLVAKTEYFIKIGIKEYTFRDLNISDFCSQPSDTLYCVMENLFKL